MSDELLADSIEFLTPVEVSLQGCHDQLGGDAAGLPTTQVVDHVDEVTQTEEVFEPEEDAKYHSPMQCEHLTASMLSACATVCHIPIVLVHPAAIRVAQILHSPGIKIRRSRLQALSCQGLHVILQTGHVTYN